MSSQSVTLYDVFDDEAKNVQTPVVNNLIKNVIMKKSAQLGQLHTARGGKDCGKRNLIPKP